MNLDITTALSMHSKSLGGNLLQTEFLDPAGMICHSEGCDAWKVLSRAILLNRWRIANRRISERLKYSLLRTKSSIVRICSPCSLKQIIWRDILRHGEVRVNQDAFCCEFQFAPGSKIQNHNYFPLILSNDCSSSFPLISLTATWLPQRERQFRPQAQRSKFLNIMNSINTYCLVVKNTLWILPLSFFTWIVKTDLFCT